MTVASFVSPLTDFNPNTVSTLDFGNVRRTARLRALAAELEAEIHRPIEDLPAPLRAEARHLIEAYPGPDRPFIGLFYVPVWSFLAHVPGKARSALDDDTLRAARSAHALSLFLHLWDDHLSDNQLPTDMLRLQMRTLAWQRFRAAADRLAEHLPADDRRIERLLADYLVTTHKPSAVQTFAAYCDRFNMQAGIWRIVPTVVGHVCAGEEAARDLDSVICDFAAAWRVMDDLQDLEDDIRSGQENAVFHLLEAEERRTWLELRARLGSASETAAWARFWSMFERGRIAERTLDRIAVVLGAAEATARRSGWPSLARELAAARQFQT